MALLTLTAIKTLFCHLVGMQQYQRPAIFDDLLSSILTSVKEDESLPHFSSSEKCHKKVLLLRLISIQESHQTLFKPQMLQTYQKNWKK